MYDIRSDIQRIGHRDPRPASSDLHYYYYYYYINKTIMQQKGIKSLHDNRNPLKQKRRCSNVSYYLFDSKTSRKCCKCSSDIKHVKHTVVNRRVNDITISTVFIHSLSHHAEGSRVEKTTKKITIIKPKLVADCAECAVECCQSMLLWIVATCRALRTYTHCYHCVVTVVGQLLYSQVYGIHL